MNRPTTLPSQPLRAALLATSLAAPFVAFLATSLAAPLAAQSGDGAHAASAAAKVQNATSAGPAAVAGDATVLDWPAHEGGATVVLRQGTNGWTCFPDMATTPADDPMCLDEVWLAWLVAWAARKPFVSSRPGIGYMLLGGSDPSNTDPFASEPPAGEDWVRTGPHLMVFVPDWASLDAVEDDPASGGPFVMFRGTPFAHLMVPVR